MEFSYETTAVIVFLQLPATQKRVIVMDLIAFCGNHFLIEKSFCKNFQASVMREQIASVDSIGDVVIFDIDRLRAIEKDESSEAPGRVVKDRVSFNLPEELLLAGTRLRLRSVTCHLYATAIPSVTKSK